jgi:hypothetical protein
MPIIAVIHLAFAIFFAVHAVRTGRPNWWLFVLLSFPMLGSIVYFFSEYMGDMRHTRQGRKAIKAVTNIVDPHRELREATIEFDRTPTAYNRARLAQALLAKGEVQQSIDHYKAAASGMYAKDPSFLKGLGIAQLAGEQFADAARTFETLFEAHPDQKVGQAALMHAEALAGAQRPEARAAFEAVIAADSTIEVQVKYGLFLLARGDKQAARTALENALKDVNRGNRHSRDMNREWIDAAQGALKTLDAPAA